MTLFFNLNSLLKNQINSLNKIKVKMNNLVKYLIAGAILTLSSASTFAQTNKKIKILFVLTSHHQLRNTGKKTGFWIEEFATPYYFFTDKNIEVTVATPNGGQAPIDLKSNEPNFQTDATKRYFSDAVAQKILSNSVKLSSVNQKYLMPFSILVVTVPCGI